MRAKHKPCLLLNADYTPITILDWQRSIKWYFKIQSQKKPVLDIIAYHNEYAKAINIDYRIPSIMKSNTYIKHNRNSIKFCRKNIFLRDNYMCQYCGKIFTQQYLTYDHVIPKSKWPYQRSPTCWTNIVTACYKCNKKKSNRTPKEANMNLLNNPIIPAYHQKYLPWYDMLSNIGYVPDWQDFLHTECVTT